MRKYAILGCAIGVIACRGGDERRDSLTRDTTTAVGPAAVAPVPSPQGDSIASRPRTPGAGTSAPDARKSPPSRRGTSSSPEFIPETKVPSTKLVPPASASTDTIRGIVSVVGTEHERHVTIASPGGGKRVEITGPLAAIIGHVAGADVWVVGTRSGTAIEASRFIVKTVDGMPALDGTLKTEGPALYLVTPDGTRTRIIAPPPPLLGHDGARVWITGDPSRGVASFGFIDPPG